MKTNRFGYLLLVLGLAALACSNLSALEPPSVQTLQARAAVTQTAQVLADLNLENGLIISAPDTTQAFLEKGQQIQILESLAAEQYTPEELSQAGKTYTYTIKLPQEQSFLWGSNWCATTEKIMHDNFKHITFEFSVEDTPIPSNQFLIWENKLDDMQCRLYYTIVKRWPSRTARL